MTSSFFMDELPIQVLPALAEAVGFQEAAILQTVHYWLQAKVNTKFMKGGHWVHNLGDLLHQRFYFWRREDIDDQMAQLEQSGLLITLPPSSKDFNTEVPEMTYHTIDYERLTGLKKAPIKLVPVAPFIADILPPTNKRTSSSFTATVHQKGDNLYTLEVHDLTHFLTCDLVLEIHDKAGEDEGTDLEGGPVAPGSRQVIGHFPRIADEEFREFIWEDETLHGILMMRFHMKIMEELLLFCAVHQALHLTLFADDEQAEELEIYREFLVSQDQTLTSHGEKTEMIFPADQQAFDRWVDFMEDMLTKFRQILWREQKTNPAVQRYLRLQPLPEV